MRRRGRPWRAGPIAFLAAIPLFLAAACSAPGSTPSAASSTSSTPSASKTTTTTAPAISPTVVPTTLLPPAHVGDLVSIPAIDSSPTVQARLLTFVDPGVPAGQSSNLVDGDRYVGVQLQVSFSGGAPPQENFNNDTTVEDSQGAFYSASDVALANCPSFAASSSAAVATGCVTFEVASDATITDVAFTPLGDFGSVSAEWGVP